MMLSSRTPSVDLQGLKRITFGYDRKYDVAVFHLGVPQTANTDEVDDSWYLRNVDDEIVGLELHGLKRILRATPAHSMMFKPVAHEIEAVTGLSFDREDIRAEGSVQELPCTTQFLLILIGRSIEKYETMRQAEYQEAARRLLAG